MPAVFAALCLAVRVAPAQTIVFVDQHATELVPDGASWCSAYKDLQDVLTVAVVDTEIRVADGIYKPTPGLNRTSTFHLKIGVAILGGFAGCDALDPDLRDLSQFVSILSGDLQEDDVEVPSSDCCRAHGGLGCASNDCQAAVCAERASCCSDVWDRSCAALAAIHCCDDCGNRCDNSYHVVVGSNSPPPDETAVLDGFTITGGFADGNNPSDRGAGIFNGFPFDSTPTFRNCRIRGNVARSKGAGVSNELAAPTYTNCAIYGNVAPLGAGMYNNGSSPTLINSTVVANTAMTNAGGIWNILFEGQYVTLLNTLVWNNADNGGTDESGQMNISIGNVIVDHSTVQGWTGVFGGIGNNGDNPLFVDLPGPDGLYGTSDDDLTLSPGSPAINRGDPATEIENGATDVAGSPRLTGCRVDRGAFESGEVQTDFDYDADGSVTLADYAAWQRCLGVSPSETSLHSTCLCLFDADGSNTLDIADIAPFQAALDGP